MAQALVTLTFDDGLRCQFESAVPVLDQLGFPATFFLTANTDSVHEPWLGERTKGWRKIDWREEDISTLKKVIRSGHEIGSHSVTHHGDKMREHPQIEASKSKQLIEGWVEAEVSSFSYPYYNSHAFLVDAVKSAGYGQARGGAQASYYAIPDDGSLDRFNIDCRQISRNENVSGWVRPRCWHILTYHGIGGPQDGWEPISFPEFTQQMTELATHRKSGAVEIVTFKDGAERLRRGQ
jgi:peptidoglycan/xylan/chitin deacetylase (PgdA/CDA1 family)